MNIDANFLTLLGVFVAVGGVIATLVAPSLTKQARVYYEIDPTSRVRRDVGHSGVSITVSHGNRIITSPVYVFSVRIHNGGQKDLVAADFVDPIRISSGMALRFLSADASSPDGVQPNVDFETDHVTLSWRILKPKESVTIRGVLTADAPVSLKEISDSLSVMARLRDVQVGKPRSWPLGTAIACLSVILLVGILGGGILLPGVLAKDYVGYHVGPESRIIVPRDGEYRDCLNLPANKWISDCKRIDSNEVIKHVDGLEITKGRYGIRLSALMFISAAALLYGIGGAVMFVTMRRIFGTIRRRVHEY